MRVMGALAGVGLAGWVLAASACSHNAQSAGDTGKTTDESTAAAEGSAGQPAAAKADQDSQVGDQAQPGMESGQTMDEGVPSQRPFAGHVVGIDRENNTLTLDNGAMIAVGSDATFKKDGRDASFNDIQPGDEVRASFAPGSRVLEGFTVTSPSSPATSQ